MITRSQAAALKSQLVSSNDPEELVRNIKKDAASKKKSDAATAVELDNLADMFISKVHMGTDPLAALSAAMANMGVGGRRKKTRKSKSKKARKTRKH